MMSKETNDTNDHIALPATRATTVEVQVKPSKVHIKNSCRNMSFQDPTMFAPVAPQMIMRTPLPLPGSQGAPFFDGNHVTEFLNQFEDMCIDYNVSQKDMLTKLPRYCSHTIQLTILSLPEWIDSEWEKLKTAMLSEYKSYDAQQKMFTRQFLEAYKSILRTPPYLSSL